MTEAEIVAQLKQNVQAPEDNILDTRPAPKEPEVNLATTAIGIDLDEVTQYKLHDYFGEPYKANDEVGRQQLQYIYSEVAKLIPDVEYGFVVAKIRELERMIGLTNSEQRRYKLYQWLKLNNVRREVDAEMGAIGA